MFQVSGHMHFKHILLFTVSTGFFEIKAILNLFPEEVQNFDIFRTRDISRTLSIYSVKIQHINPSRPNPGRREKKKLIFYFKT